MLLHFLGLMVVVSPALLLAVLGISSLLHSPLSELTISRFSKISSSLGLFASLMILGYMLISGSRDVPLAFGDWVSMHASTDAEAVGETRLLPPANSSQSAAATTPKKAEASPKHEDKTASEHGAGDHHANELGGFHFRLKFIFDRLSIPFVIMSFVLCGVIGAFASKYMHLEPGFGRFFLYYSVFQLGMILSSLAGTIETLFFGWELVGLSSALLVAFFHERASAVQNGLRVWAIYRIADAAFLMAALVLHHLAGAGDFELLMGTGDWPFGKAAITSDQALLVGSLLLIAAAGKSALVPFSGWLPRAMEGPTPSSAIFYGALSVHLGAFMLLRVSPVLEASPLLSAMVVTLGLITMIISAMMARVQTDVKSALSYASLVQVSIITIEIGCGLRYIPLIHIIGHACVRTLQLVRAPSLLKDLNALENALGDHLSVGPSLWQRWLSVSTRERFYRFAWERGYLDSMIDDYIVAPFKATFHFANKVELACTDALNGRSTRSASERAADLESIDTPSQQSAQAT